MRILWSYPDELENKVDSPRTLVEQDSELNIHVHAYDMYGVEFDEDQYVKMHFEIEIENSGIKTSNGLVPYAHPGETTLFSLEGKQPDHYIVTSFAKRSSQHYELQYSQYNQG
jgi:hypothetical protein